MTNAIPLWLPVVDWEGWYEVAHRGWVRSVDRFVLTRNGQTRFYRGRMLSLVPAPRGGGHLVVGLQRPGKVIKPYVHTLVLEAFDRPRRPGEECRHGPGGPADNRWPEAICWGSKAENEADKVRDGTSNHGERSASAKLTEAIVIECRQRWAAGELQAALAWEFGVCQPTMSDAIRGVTWSHVPLPAGSLLVASTARTISRSRVLPPGSDSHRSSASMSAAQ